MLCVCVGGGGDQLTPATAFLCLKNMTDIHTNTQRIMADVTVEAQLRVQQENEQYIHTSRVTWVTAKVRSKRG